jgi:hypothetical protein
MNPESAAAPIGGLETTLATGDIAALGGKRRKEAEEGLGAGSGVSSQ